MFQEPVACLVAITVVNGFEIVNIDKCHGKAAAGWPRCDAPQQQFGKTCPVKQVCHRIVARQELNPLLHFACLFGPQQERQRGGAESEGHAEAEHNCKSLKRCLEECGNPGFVNVSLDDRPDLAIRLQHRHIGFRVQSGHVAFVGSIIEGNNTLLALDHLKSIVVEVFFFRLPVESFGVGFQNRIALGVINLEAKYVSHFSGGRHDRSLALIEFASGEEMVEVRQGVNEIFRPVIGPGARIYRNGAVNGVVDAKDDRGRKNAHAQHDGGSKLCQTKIRAVDQHG